MPRQIGQSLRIAAVTFCTFLAGAGNGYAYTSKWDRVDALAREISEGDVSARLAAKEQLIAILLEQEADYPIIYVNKTATGKKNGQSWENAYTDIQPAIDKAAETEGWVWVAAGDYLGTYPYSDAAIKIHSKVILLGGFAGNETDVNQRNPWKNITIIRGWSGRRAVDMMHQTMIDGFTIKNSGYKNTDEMDATDVSGGGIRTRSWLSVIRNNHITGNWAKSGGGVAAWNRDNNGNENKVGYVPIIERNIIDSNTGPCGAGVNIRGTEALFCNNIVYKNINTKDLTKSKGIEIHIVPSYSGRPIIVNSILWGHRTGQFDDLYNHVDMVALYGDKAKALSYYNCIEHGGYGSGLVTSDPQFVNPDKGDFTLNSNSPCIDAGHPDGPLDLDGTRSDIGFYQPVQYLLSIDVNSVSTVATGNGWYLPGQTVTIAVDSLVVDAASNTRYVFVQWEGQAYTGSNRTPEIQITQDITEKAIWRKEYLLTVETGSALDSASGWYSADEAITLRTTRTYSKSATERSKFMNWIVEGPSTFTTQDTVLTVNLTMPASIQMATEDQFFIEVQTLYGQAVGQGWYTENTTASVSLSGTLIEQESGHRYRFTGWTGQGAFAYSGKDSAFTLIATEPMVQIAHWQEQYLIEIQSAYGSPTGAGWLDVGTECTVMIDSLIAVNETHRYRFNGWAIDGNNTIDNCQFAITVDSPHTLHVNWISEFWISLTVSPESAGNLSPYAPPGLWMAENQTITLLAAGNGQQGYGFVNWEGLDDSMSNPASFVIHASLSITANFALGDVTVDTSPTGLTIFADGIAFTSPQTFYWLPGEHHEIGTESIQSEQNGSRLTFDKWSDNGALIHEIEIGDQPITCTAVFDTSYYLNITQDKGKTSQSGWYAKGQTVQVSPDSLTQDSSGVRYRFVAWHIFGDDSTQSFGRTLSLAMNRAYTLEGQWQKQIKIETHVQPAYGGQIVYSPVQDWYDTTQPIQFEAIPIDSNFTFSRWQGAIDTAANPVVFTFVQPANITAIMTTETAFPPEIKGIEDETLLEDEALVFTLEDLAAYVSDENDPISTLSFFLEAAHFSLSWNQSVLSIFPEKNWSGTETLILKVADAYQFEDSDTFKVSVYPVPDAPGAFNLLDPPREYLVPDTMTTLLFQWSSSENVDLNDQISYVLHLDSDTTWSTPQAQTHACGRDTTVLLDIASMHGDCFWRVEAKDAQGLTTWSHDIHTISFPSSVALHEGQPGALVIDQNYPNPFNASTEISYQIPEAGNITIRIFDIRGQLVDQHMIHNAEQGQHLFHWQGENSRGDAVASGIYVFTLKYRNHLLFKKMNLVR